jgi:hypothetical protein
MTRGALVAAAVVAGLAAVGWCTNNRSEPKPAVSAPVVYDAGPGVVVPVRIDDQVVVRLAVSELRGPADLVELLPAAHRDRSIWTSLYARAAKGQEVWLMAPAVGQPDRAVILDRDSRGRLTVALAAAGKPAGPAPRSVQLRDVTDIRIATKLAPQAALDEPAPGPLSVTIDGRAPVELSADQLAGLKTYHVPGVGDGGDGWRLRDVLALAGAKRQLRSVRLQTADGPPLELSADQLQGPRYHPLLKRNRRGELRFRLWDTAGGKPAPAGELRNVVAIAVQDGD